MSATQIKTCSQCPFARLIEDNRYVCTNSETASDTVRGDWEVTRASCHDAISQLKAIPVEAHSPAQELPRTSKLTKHPFAYDWSVFNGQHSFSSSMYGKCECYECKPPAAPSPEPQPSEPDQDSHTTPEQFPPILDIETLAAEARREQNEARRLSRVVPVSAVQAIAKVPEYYLRRVEGAGTLRPDTVLAFMRVWGAAQSDSAEISKTINWLIGAPGFDMSNTLLVESLIGIQRPVPSGNQSYFGVDLKEEIEPEPVDYHDKY